MLVFIRFLFRFLSSVICLRIRFGKFPGKSILDLLRAWGSWHLNFTECPGEELEIAKGR